MKNDIQSFAHSKWRHKYHSKIDTFTASKQYGVTSQKRFFHKKYGLATIKREKQRKKLAQGLCTCASGKVEMLDKKRNLRFDLINSVSR